jgi:ribosomal protein S18 acetylase RimI-like enzyme
MPESWSGSAPRMPIRPFEVLDEEPVVALWERCGLVRPWNDPRRDIARKAGVQADLFLVAVEGEAVVGTVMAGYDGHRGWVNYLAVDPDWRRRGIGRGLMHAVETRLRALGCPKVNLQIRRTSADVAAFYRALGFAEDDVLSMGKRLIAD